MSPGSGGGFVVPQLPASRGSVEEVFMDFHEAERRFSQLQENYQNGAITAGAFYQAVSKLMIQDSQGRYWAIDAETGGWLSYDGHAWQGAVPASGDATDRIPRVLPPRRKRRTWLIGLSAGIFLLLGFLLVVGLFAYWKWNGRSYPDAAILAPAHGAEFEVGQNVTVEARCSAPVGISRVELWVDDALVIPETNLPSGSSVPVTLHWVFQDAGLHTFQVKTYSASGDVGLSDPVVVRVIPSARQHGPTVVLLDGSFEVLPGSGTGWQSADSGRMIQVGDAVRTLEDGRAQIVFADGLVAELGNNSELLLEKMEINDDRGLSVRVVSPYGDTWHRLDAGPVSLHYEVETPAALVASSGTLVHITTLPEGGMLVEVIEGDAVVIGAQQRQQIRAGQAMQVEPGQPPVMFSRPEPPPPLEGASVVTAVCTPDAMLLADVSLPDGAVVQQGQRVEKIWRVRNTGVCPWIDYTWTFVSGDRLSETSAVPVRRTEPGGTADIGVLMEAPSKPGLYLAQWQLQDAAGRGVGPIASVSVRVQTIPATQSSPSSEPRPAVTPIPFIRFRSDRDQLNLGECAELQWDVEHVESVYLDGAPAVGHDTRKICPAETTRYALCWHYEGREDCQTVIVVVNAPHRPPY